MATAIRDAMKNAIGKENYDSMQNQDVQFIDTLAFDKFPLQPVKGRDQNGKEYVACRVCYDNGLPRIFALAVYHSGGVWKRRIVESKQEEAGVFDVLVDTGRIQIEDAPLDFLQKLFNNQDECYCLIS